MYGIYKMVSSTSYSCFFLRNDISSPIWNKVEFSALNKTEKSIEGIMIKDVCWKLQVNRIGQITSINNKPILNKTFKVEESLT